MSFDLAVWPEAAVVTAAEAARKYQKLCELLPGAVPAEPRGLAFERELTARYPPLSSMAPDDESSPWNADPTVLGEAVVLTMSWSAADAVAPFVQELAERHDLVLYDPQDRTVHLPPALRPPPGLVLSAADGSRLENPDAAAIEAAVASLSAGNWYLVLDRGGHYVQVGVGERAATRSGGYALEHREDPAGRHYRVEVVDRADVVRAFTAFAAGDDTWQQAFDWRQLEF
ncbi:hypothetical protein [Amycolatopsis sp. cmx-4-68]|uniref:hypothetical protein n=1 Tax=Amycolatopsis sp. cmx-4-68 TaxID=2790938 RepID=UPI00397CDFEC